MSDASLFHRKTLRQRRRCHMIVMCMIVTLFCMVATARSQFGGAEPCVPDCEEDTWGSDQVMVITPPGFPSCSLVVVYVTRLACGVWNDFQIKNIYTPSVGCDAFKDSLTYWASLPPNNPYHITNQTRFLHDFVEKTIASSLFDLWWNSASTAERDSVTCPNAGYQQWRAARASCVAWDYSSACCPSLIKCGDACCLRLFNICRDTTLHKNIVTTVSGTLVTSCPGPSEEGGPYLVGLDNLCFPLCDDAEWPEDKNVRKFWEGSFDMSSR